MNSVRKWTRGLAALIVAGCALAAAAPAFAAGRILDVRIGRHDEFTRIVFELDAASAHQVEQKPGATELVVRLGAGSPAREILSNSDVVQSVRLEPKGGETIARVLLRSPRVRVSELTLESPPRLVIDVRPGEPAPAITPVAKPAPSAPAVAPPAKPPTPVAKPSAPPAVAPAPAPPAPIVVAEEVDEVEEVEEIDTTELLVQADTEASADDAADDEAAAAASAAAPAVPPKPAAPAPAPTPAPVAPRPPLPTVEPPGGKGVGGYLPEGIDSRWLFGAVALLLAFLLWGLLGRRDRTTREVEAADEAPANVFADRAAPAAWTEPTSAAESTAPTIEVPREDEPAERDEEEAAPPSDLPLFTPRTEPAPLEAAEEDDMPAPVERGGAPRHLSVVPVEPPAAPEPAGPAFGATPPPASGASFDVGSRVADLERRIALLERKLEDAADVRERLERQVVAQTEELRVQRAAIARTQRVLRTLARPDDLPIEPAPRGSGPTGSGT